MIIQTEEKPVEWLKKAISQTNVAGDFEQHILDAIGNDVISQYDIDKNSRTEWEQTIRLGIELANQTMDRKSWPWDGAANTKDPLMSVASMQFASRAGAEVVRGQDVVKCKTTGEDPESAKEKRAKRISTFMSYQCLETMSEWLPDTDQLLMSISPIGMYYKKTYWDEVLKRPVSIAVSPLKLVLNKEAKTLETSPHYEEMEFSYNAILERIRSEIWLDITDKLPEDQDVVNEDFIEAHCFYDLDGDGYREPWIVTVCKKTTSVVRIAARYDENGIDLTKKGEVSRIKPNLFYTEFPFLPSIDGSYYKTGWCKLLSPMIEEINTIQNQLIDAGTLSNVGGGFVGKGTKLPAGGLRFRVGQYIPVESTGQSLRDNIFPNPAKEPSAVLFNLLARLGENANKLASVSETMMGELPTGNTPATTVLASLDQGLKVYTNILFRLFRSFKGEFEKLYRLDYFYLTDKEYMNVLDISAQDLQEMGIDPALINEDSRELVKKDFNLADCDVQPVIDPSASSEAIRLARANALLQSDPQNPEVRRDYYKAIGIAESRIEAYIPKQDPNAAPSPEAIKMQLEVTKAQAEAENKSKEIELKHAEVEQKEAIAVYQIEKLKAEIVEIKSRSILNLANAEKAEIGTQVDIYKAEMEQLNAATEQAAQSAEEPENGTDEGATADGGGNPEASGTENGGGGIPAMDNAPINPEGGGLPVAGAGGYQGDASIGAGSNGTGESGSVLGKPVGDDLGARPSTGLADFATTDGQPMR